MQELTARYEELKEKVSERRAQFAELMRFVETETEYLTAPASTKFHLCKESGLLEHSVNVAENLLKIKNVLAPDISDESCVVVALLHDLGKAGMAKNPLYLKNPPDSKWKQPYYWNKNLVYLSVPVRSLYLVASRFPLTEEEVNHILRPEGESIRRRPTLDVQPGQQVLINSGAFESLPATVAEVDRERGKLKAVVEMFGRETVAELDFEQVEKI